MNRVLFFFAAESAEKDGKAITAGLIILCVLFLFLGLLGTAVRYTMRYQGDRADNYMSIVTRAKVFSNEREWLAFARKKNHRVFFRSSLIPVLIALIGGVIWLIENLVTKNWAANIFADFFHDLFFHFDWQADGVIVKIFGLPLIGAFPPVTHSPEFILAHLCHYIETAILLVSWGYEAVVCQAFIARAIRARSKAHDLFHDDLKDVHQTPNVEATPDHPQTPQD